MTRTALRFVSEIHTFFYKNHNFFPKLRDSYNFDKIGPHFVEAVKPEWSSDQGSVAFLKNS